jgi:ribosomal protein S18 acetylase RimI-like enzyme
LGKALLDYAKNGRTFLKLNSHAANTRAHAFYRREGFTQIGDPWLGDDGIDEITMEWRA